MTEQLDFIYLVSGATFLFAAYLMWARAHQTEGKRRWDSLSGFVALVGLIKWSMMVALGIGPNAQVELLQLVSLAVGYIFLVEVARRAYSFGARPYFAVEAHLLNITIIVCAYLSLGKGWIAIGSAGFLLIGAGLAQRPLLSIFANGISARPHRIVSAIALLLSGVLAMVEALLPENLAYLFELGQIVCASSVVVSVWHAYLPLNIDGTRGTPYRHWPIPLGLAGVLGLGLLFVNWYADSVEDSLRDVAINQAEEVTKAIGASLDGRNRPTSDGADDELSQRISKQLRAYAKALTLRRLFSLQWVDGKVHFGPDSIDGMKRAGEIYSAPSEELLDALKSNQLRIIKGGLSADERGLMALAPVFNPHTSSKDMVIGIELDAEAWERSIAQARLKILVGLAVISLVLMLSAISLDNRSRLSEGARSWWMRNTEVAIAIIFGAGLTLTIAVVANRWEQSSKKLNFEQHADVQAEDVIDAMRAVGDDDLVSLAEFIESNPNISPRSFGMFSKSLQATQAYEWAPRVPYADRKSFEETVRRLWYPNFMIFERDASGHRVPAGKREFYYPVLFAEPFEANESAIGFDLGSESIRRAALSEVEQTGLVSATEPINLVQYSKKEPGVLVFYPVNRSHSSELAGVAISVLRLNAILADLEPSAEEPSKIRLDLFELPEDGKPVWLASSSVDGATYDRRKTELSRPSYLSDCPIFPIFLFGRAYALSASAEHAFFEAYPMQVGPIVFVAGLVMTALLAAVVSNLSHHRETLEEEIRLRTRKLSASEESSRRLFTENKTMMLLIDPETDSVMDANAAALEFYGYTKDDFVGMAVHTFDSTPPAVRREFIETALRTGGARCEAAHRLANGTQRIVDESLSKIDSADGPRLHSIIFDITVQKKSEKELQKVNVDLELALSEARDLAERADAANRAKSQFLANISHEVRTPMNGVLGMLSLIRDTKLSSEQRELCDVACASGDSLLGIINDILDFSRIESGKFQISTNAFNLRESIRGLEFMLSVGFEQKGVVLAIEIKDDVPNTLVGDFLRIRQVLINLLGNALKFTPSGGAVALLIESLGISENYARIHFCVIDSGIGIKGEYLERIFQAFEQADTTTTRQFGGTGLGLTISKQLVELMGSTLRVCSLPNVGSRFDFELMLPLAEAVAPQPQMVKKTSVVAGFSPLSILVAEDNLINQKVIERALRSAGHTVKLAGDGRQAVDEFAKGKFDLVLMDVQMPIMDGVQALKEIRAHSGANQHVPIIVITAHAMAGDKERYLAEGFDDYASKPFKREELLNKIQQVVRSNQKR